MEGSGCEGVGDREMEEERKGRTERGEGQREGDGQREGERKKGRKGVRECVCVRERG